MLMFIFTLLLIIYHDDRLVEYSFNIVLMQVATRKLQNLLQKSQYSFSGFAGPYNPYLYKDHLVPRAYPTNKQLYNYVKNQDKIVTPPIRNMRHINPIRQSGPLPSYYGTYTMQDMKKLFDQFTMGKDINYCQMDVDQVMRRVPGITRKQVQHIVQMGLSPYEQVRLAYLTYHIGYDIFYAPNGVYIARHVVTNSKGQKVEVFWNSMCFQDLSVLNVNFAPVLQAVDYHWQIFLWADPPIKVTGDLDLGVPNTWFEYETEWSTQMVIALDQSNIPENIRPFDTGRNPHSRNQLWKSQQQLQQQLQMRSPEWKLTYV